MLYKVSHDDAGFAIFDVTDEPLVIEDLRAFAHFYDEDFTTDDNILHEGLKLLARIVCGGV